MTIKLMCAFALAFLFATAFGKVYIPWLKKEKARQSIREDGPTWHMNKSGTPTMGGVMFILATALICLTLGFPGMLKGNFVHIFVLLFALVFGAIGFLCYVLYQAGVQHAKDHPDDRFAQFINRVRS